MRIVVAILCAFAVFSGQYFTGSTSRPVLALPTYLLLGLAGICSIPLAWARGFSWPRWDCLAWAGGFLLWAIARQLTSADPWMASAYLRLTIGCALMYLIVASAMGSPTFGVWFVGALMVDGLLQAALGVAQFGGMIGGVERIWSAEYNRVDQSIFTGPVMTRAQGLYLNPNHFAWFLTAVGLFAIAFACLGRGRAWQKVLFAYVGITCMGAMIICLSRGGVIALVAGIASMVVLALAAIFASGSGKRWTIASVVIAAVVFPIVIAVILISQSIDIQMRLNQLFVDSYRPKLWQIALRHLQVEPLVGTGAGSFIDYSRLYRSYSTPLDDYQAHNDWIQVTGEYGFVGFSLLLIAAGAHLRAGWQAYRVALRSRLAVGSLPQSNSSALLMGGLAVAVAFCVHSLVDFNLQVVPNALLAAAVAGMLAGSRSLGSEEVGRSAFQVPRIFVTVATLMTSIVLLLLVWRTRGEAWALAAENNLILGRSGDANLEMTRAIEMGRENPWIRLMAGRVALNSARELSGDLRREQNRVAQEELEEAIRLAPHGRLAYTALATVCLAEGDLAAAKKHSVQAIVLDPYRAVSWETLGLVEQRQGNLNEAVRFYGLAAGFLDSTVDPVRLRQLMELEKSREVHRQ